MNLRFRQSNLTWFRHNVTESLQQLESGGVDYADRSYGPQDMEALRFEAPARIGGNRLRRANQKSYFHELIGFDSKSS